MMFRIKSRVSTALFAFLAILLVVSAITTNLYATPIVIDPSEGIDVVLVIDTSGSMNNSDPERITLEAAALFMDMMETRHSRIGIVGFSGVVHSVMPLSPINTVSTRNQIRNTVSNFVYHGWTDIGLGLRTAVEMINENPAPNNSPMILLFTDGRIELNEALGRTVAQSYDDAWWAVENVAEGVPIYTIGLNYDGVVNADFLREIAARTHGESHIIEDAALLPELFHRIFANHIRSSIHEVATIVPYGDEFNDVIIPIPSNFVAEANIIMLSTRPITDVRLFDPSGREIEFDDYIFTLTSANRYSMIKIMEPVAGDWLLRVRGLQEDRITVNLIYNYTVDVAFSITQPEMTGAFFDPTYPVLVQASFITPLSAAQIRDLFFESVAEVNVFDLNNNLLEIIPMEFNGTAFIAELTPNPPQNVRINIDVTHPGFTQTTTTVTVTFDPDQLQALRDAPPPVPQPDPPTPIDDPTPPTTPVVEDETPAPPREDRSSNLWLFLLLGILIVVILAALLFVVFNTQTKRNAFVGHLEVRSLLSNGKYTALEAPSLNTFAGKISLEEFFKVSLGEKANRILEADIPIDGTYIEPVIVNNRSMIRLTTDGACIITDPEKNEIPQRKFIWENDIRLTFSLADEIEKIEITYRINED